MSGGMDNGHDGPFGHSMKELRAVKSPDPTPPQYVCVPVEPTPEMVDAYYRLGLERIRRGLAGIESIAPFKESIKQNYGAMIAASPNTHVAISRELLEDLELWARHKLGGPVVECIADKEAVRKWAELRGALLPK